MTKRVKRPGIGHNRPPKALKKSTPLSFDFGDEIPSNLGIVADHFKEVQALRLEMEKQAKEVKARETELKDHLIENLAVDEDDDTGAAGLKYRAQITVSEKGSADDWEDIYDFVADKNRFDLMGKSLNQKAVEEIWATGAKIPGVSRVKVKKVSITKL